MYHNLLEMPLGVLMLSLSLAWMNCWPNNRVVNDLKLHDTHVTLLYYVLNHLEVHFHYGDVIMDAIASKITSLTIVYSIVYSDADQRKHQSSATLAFVRGIHRRPVNSPHKWPVTRKIFPFDDVIMNGSKYGLTTYPICTYFPSKTDTSCISTYLMPIVTLA